MLHSSDSDEIINWESEAEAIIRDVNDHVSYIAVAKNIQSSPQEIYLNLKTIEDKDFCIRASSNGFQIVGEQFDQILEERIKKDDDGSDEEVYETPYALLNKISPRYVESFARKLSAKLEKLENQVE